MLPTDAKRPGGGTNAPGPAHRRYPSEHHRSYPLPHRLRLVAPSDSITFDGKSGRITFTGTAREGNGHFYPSEPAARAKSASLVTGSGDRREALAGAREQVPEQHRPRMAGPVTAAARATGTTALAERQLAQASDQELESIGLPAGDACDDPNAVRVIGYARVSTREQGDSGHGMAAQGEAIREACSRRGWHLAGIESDVISSRRKSRPGLERAMRQAAKAGGVVVSPYASRVARSTVELLMIHERATQEGWHLICLDMEQVDTTTPVGRMIRTVLAAFGEFERDLISQRTREALAAAKASGVKVGRPRALESGRPDERRRAERALPRLRELRADGLSYRAIADTLNGEGVEGLHGGRWWDRTARLALIRYGESG